TVIKVLDDPLAAAQFSDAVLAAQTSQDNADLLLRRKLAAGNAADFLHHLPCRFLPRPGFLSHLRSFNGYDGPEILPSSTRPFCPIGADAGQSEVYRGEPEQHRPVVDGMKIGFAVDSPLEGGGFEPSVPGHGEL